MGWGVAVGSGGCGAVLRQRWDYLASCDAYHVIITIPNVADAQQIEAAEHLYTQLNSSGIETLLDDRDERAGVNLKMQT